MFAHANIRDPPPETLMLIEDIVCAHVIEMAVQAAAGAQIRGAKALSENDFIFLLRHDAAKLNKLIEFIKLKNASKGAKDQSDKASGGGGGGAGVDDLGDDLGDDLAGEAAVAGGGAKGGAGGASGAGGGEDKGKKAVKLPWDWFSVYADSLNAGAEAAATMSSFIGQDGSSALASVLSMPEEDEEEQLEQLELSANARKRLREADEKTRAMTREEYLYFADARQASFTYKRNKKFREWVNFPAHISMKPNDNIIDILGFLAFDLVVMLATNAKSIMIRRVQLERIEQARKRMRKMKNSAQSGGASEDLENGDGGGDGADNPFSSNIGGGEGSGGIFGTAFDGHASGSTGKNILAMDDADSLTMLPEHIYEAQHQLRPKTSFLQNFRSGKPRFQR
ncbi:hypothetical protein GQ42DRAFT_163970, partial [Ramicandelaber brevisporus]